MLTLALTRSFLVRRCYDHCGHHRWTVLATRRVLRYQLLRTMASIETVSLSASPAEGQVIAHDGKTYTTVREGLAYILIPVDSSSTVDPKLNGKTGMDTSPA